MCGRYYRRSDKQRIGDTFNIADLPSSLILSEDYNVAPTTFQPVIRNDKETGDRELVFMRWGLVPFFTKQLSDVKGISTINARSEGIEKSRTWRTPFQKRRCLVPADGYFEWAHLDNKTKKPLAIRRFTEFINTGDKKMAEELIAPNVIFWVPGRPDPPMASEIIRWS